MHIDLSTLYLLAIGTLLAAAGMTFWERKARPERRRMLDACAMAYAALALGCLAAPCRAMLPGAIGGAVSNLLITAGYLLILEGIASLRGRSWRGTSTAMLVALGLLWAVGGTAWQAMIWNYAAGVPIAVASGLAAREMLRNLRFREARSRRIVIAVTGGYAVLYAMRSLVLPVVVSACGPAAAAVLALAGIVTMYAGVLYSVVLPMALLTLIREEAQGELVRLSLTDHLTGVGNRRAFLEDGARLLAGAADPIALLAFDIDHFKAINDRHGHATGDEVLRSFARVVRTTLGDDAIVARMGGEEFAALLPGCDSDRARAAGETVAQNFARAVALTSNGTAVTATVSIGVAECVSPDADLAALLAAADRALYAAKALGRNRVETAPAEIRAAA